MDEVHGLRYGGRQRTVSHEVFVAVVAVEYGAGAQFQAAARAGPFDDIIELLLEVGNLITHGTGSIHNEHDIGCQRNFARSVHLQVIHAFCNGNHVIGSGSTAFVFGANGSGFFLRHAFGAVPEFGLAGIVALGFPEHFAFLVEQLHTGVADRAVGVVDELHAVAFFHPELPGAGIQGKGAAVQVFPELPFAEVVDFAGSEQT